MKLSFCDFAFLFSTYLILHFCCVFQANAQFEEIQSYPTGILVSRDSPANSYPEEIEDYPTTFEVSFDSPASSQTEEIQDYPKDSAVFHDSLATGQAEEELPGTVSLVYKESPASGQAEEIPDYSKAFALSHDTPATGHIEEKPGYRTVSPVSAVSNETPAFSVSPESKAEMRSIFSYISNRDGPFSKFFNLISNSFRPNSNKDDANYFQSSSSGYLSNDAAVYDLRLRTLLQDLKSGILKRVENVREKLPTIPKLSDSESFMDVLGILERENERIKNFITNIPSRAAENPKVTKMQELHGIEQDTSDQSNSGTKVTTQSDTESTSVSDNLVVTEHQNDVDKLTANGLMKGNLKFSPTKMKNLLKTLQTQASENEYFTETLWPKLVKSLGKNLTLEDAKQDLYKVDAIFQDIIKKYKDHMEQNPPNTSRDQPNEEENNVGNMESYIEKLTNVLKLPTKETFQVDIPSYFNDPETKMNTFTGFAGAAALGMLAFGALMGTPTLPGILRRSDDSAGESWLDSLAFWKNDREPSIYIAGEDVASNKLEYYNPYFAMPNDAETTDDYNYDYKQNDYKQTDYNTYYTDEDNYRRQYPDDNLQMFIDPNYNRPGYYSAEGAEKKEPEMYTIYGSRKGPERKAYESPERKAYESPERKAYDKKKFVPIPLSRDSPGQSFDVHGGYSVRDYPDYEKDFSQHEEDDGQEYITVQEVNDIAEESLKEILKNYENYRKQLREPSSYDDAELFWTTSEEEAPEPEGHPSFSPSVPMIYSQWAPASRDAEEEGPSSGASRPSFHPKNPYDDFFPSTDNEFDSRRQNFVKPTFGSRNRGIRLRDSYREAFERPESGFGDYDFPFYEKQVQNKESSNSEDTSKKSQDNTETSSGDN